VQQVRFACAQINRVLKEAGVKAKIECKQHEFNANVAVIRVEGVSLEITNAEGFARAAEFATNTEIYPLTNGNVRMTFTFHGLLIPV
ncbi:MAG: hypothetical protein IKZ36_02275, partial [Kiritimatiellae bacterium]|nr:hypothetical protein [Kiritimatiellia bacterium]